MIETIERDSINSMSFLPSRDNLNKLIQQSNKASSAKRGSLISKLHFLDPKFGLAPENLDPNDTILAKLGRGTIGPGGKIGNKNIMTIIDDRNMPLGGGSCGPNGVLTECQARPYGPQRINLFYKNRKETEKLLIDYLGMRDDNINDVFKMFVNKLVKHRDNGFKIDLAKDAILDPSLHNDYSNTCDMFQQVLKQLKYKSLSECGISCNSFCQTWLRNGGTVGDAQFSVMSPHFQTRFFVSNEKDLKACGVSNKMIKSYEAMIIYFTNSMQKDYGIDGGGQAFINLDDLAKLIEYEDVPELYGGFLK